MRVSVREGVGMFGYRAAWDTVRRRAIPLVETVLEGVKHMTDKTAPWAVVEVQDAALRQDPVAQLLVRRT